MGPDPAAGLKPSLEQDPSRAQTSVWAIPHCVGGSFMYYHKVYHGELGISMPCSLGSLYQALQITVLPINVSTQAQGCLSQSPAQLCAPSQLSVSLCEACWSQYLQVTPSGAERSLCCVAQ